VDKGKLCPLHHVLLSQTTTNTYLLTLSSVLLEKNLELVAGTDLIAPKPEPAPTVRLLLPRIRSVF
jgi:hypothetical protein